MGRNKTSLARMKRESCGAPRLRSLYSVAVLRRSFMEFTIVRDSPPINRFCLATDLVPVEWI